MSIFNDRSSPVRSKSIKKLYILDFKGQIETSARHLILCYITSQPSDQGCRNVKILVRTSICGGHNLLLAP